MSFWKRWFSRDSASERSTAQDTVSVVLRRQVPIRFDEEPRSWLGGLPKLPAGTEWPHASAGRPLHFVAQVDCASLPRELWGGLGPREGWLLLFADFEAIEEEDSRPIARVLHVRAMSPEAEPPDGLYFARRDVVDLCSLPEVPKGAQRRHFRKWPVDLVSTGADTSSLTGSELYGALEHDLALGAHESFTSEHPMTWRGACTVLTELVRRYNAAGYEGTFTGNGGLLDYPEPDASGRNAEWQQRREGLAERVEFGYFSPQFTEADGRLQAQVYEERRQGWTQRAFKVIDEELTNDAAKIAEHRGELAAARNRGDESSATECERQIESREKSMASHREHRVYLENLFAKYPSEEAFVEEINRVGRAHLEWAQQTQDRLHELLAQAAKNDLDAPVAPGDWDAIVTEIGSMKSEYWTKTYGTNLLQKVERGVHFSLNDVLREEALDRYASPPSSAHGLEADLLADLEPRLRNLECERPHKLGGSIDSVYDEPLEEEHLLLFQLASDAAIGWIWGDLGFLYVSIHPSDLEAGSFDNVKAWLEA
ncbi:MAG: DUF1963 domain-containing protein [Bryobacterales bacterium]|nr:DUF1963 domain-containing protein [Bryobacterales bacterium]